MKLSELRLGERFKFPGVPGTYENRGRGWYSTPQGYDGGPWHRSADTEVVSSEHELNNAWEAHLQNCVDNGRSV